MHQNVLIVVRIIGKPFCRLYDLEHEIGIKVHIIAIQLRNQKQFYSYGYLFYCQEHQGSSRIMCRTDTTGHRIEHGRDNIILYVFVALLCLCLPR